VCITAIAVSSLVALGACGDDSSGSSGSGGSGSGLPATIPVAVIVPTTGPLALYGNQVVAGVKAGEEYINSTGILGSSKFEFSFKDSASAAPTAASLTQAEVKGGTVGIVGSPISNEALASAPIANSAKVPYLANSAPGPQLPGLGEYVYSMSTPQGVQLTAYIQDLVKEAPKVSVVFASDIETTVGLSKTVQEAVPAAGGTFVQAVPTTLTATDSRVVATKAMRGSPDAIGILSGGAQLPALVTELKSLGFTGRIFANEGAEVSAPSAGAKLNGLEFQGEWATNVSNELSTAFADAMKKTSPDLVPAFPAVDGFNSIRFLAEALAKAKSTDGPALLTALQGVAGGQFLSPGGAVTFTGDGKRQLESPVINLVTNDGVVTAQE
jgi:branched-chain amino acid transport system substrate-binding protein